MKSKISPKGWGRTIVCKILETQVRRLRRHHDFKVIAVAGAVGKTSTKMAIAELLQATRQVMWQKGNYNDRVTIPLVFFGHQQPNIFNVGAWLRIFLKNERIIRKSYPYQMVVVELGTDGPGFMREFAYIRPDLAVLTAIVPEHMQYFGTLEAVAREELGILDFSAQALVNADDTPMKFLKDRQFKSYGFGKRADYQVLQWQQNGLEVGTMTLALPDAITLEAQTPILGRPGAKVVLAAVAVAHMLGLSPNDIEEGLPRIKPFPGRMQILEGIQDSIIIDDTYNASPPAVKAALDVLYSAQATQRVAILGSINQMGDYSPEAHREVGAYCDPQHLDLVVTVGADAETYMAPVIRETGCELKSFSNPHAAGEFVKQHLQPGAVVLAKGSEGGLYIEEAVKPLLKNSDDYTRLVRQSARWMKKKSKHFSK